MALPCDQCTEVLDFREARPQCKAHVHSNDAVCIRNLRAALAHERDRAKRVVRVFWRVRWDNFGAPVWMTYSLRDQAMAVGKRHKSDGAKVYRAVVRRVAKKAP